MANEVFKTPVSVLALIHTPALEVLLIERALHRGFWQSVTGSLEADESPRETAAREVAEETGIVIAASNLHDWHLSNRFEIFQQWRHRYAPGVTHNVEHVFSLELPAPCEVHLAPREHVDAAWLPWREAAARCFSWSNRDAILMLPSRVNSPMSSPPRPK
ncbi:dihydroneopterin triphosphate diphosphatase [Uliginosibacterium sp. H3]|uniref:Dihydroneopterin triphosphate diphosphatase n=1 Tax=Uliginosibacterium silvisoli TaxID=3114758 RepID=A0ABU6K6B4_9RHOO|nr:dihydroneopterin triphosphate diphosphatase [Uliginosibacterium sp. H3]